MSIKIYLYFFTFGIIFTSCAVKKQSAKSFGGAWHANTAKLQTTPTVTDTTRYIGQYTKDSFYPIGAVIPAAKTPAIAKRKLLKTINKKVKINAFSLLQTKDPEPKKNAEQNEIDPKAAFGLIFSVLGVLTTIFGVFADIYYLFFFDAYIFIFIGIFITLLGLVLCAVSLAKYSNKTNTYKHGKNASLVGIIVSGLFIAAILTVITLLFGFDNF